MTCIVLYSVVDVRPLCSFIVKFAVKCLVVLSLCAFLSELRISCGRLRQEQNYSSPVI